MTKDNLPIISEQLIIENETTKSTQTQLQASDILKTKQLIPHNFIQLETKAKNYMCSTEGWKEPVCERYGFTYERKWIQLDIPCEVMEKLELEKGESISYPVYVSSELLNKEIEFGGITLEKEEEVFLLKPLSSDKEVQTEVSGEDVGKISELENLVNDLQTQLNQKNGQIRELQVELDKEKNWIDKYVNSPRNNLNLLGKLKEEWNREMGWSIQKVDDVHLKLRYDNNNHLLDDNQSNFESMGERDIKRARKVLEVFLRTVRSFYNK